MRRCGRKALTGWPAEESVGGDSDDPDIELAADVAECLVLLSVFPIMQLSQLDACSQERIFRAEK